MSIFSRASDDRLHEGDRSSSRHIQRKSWLLFRSWSVDYNWTSVYHDDPVQASLNLFRQWTSCSSTGIQPSPDLNLDLAEVFKLESAYSTTYPDYHFWKHISMRNDLSEERTTNRPAGSCWVNILSIGISYSLSRFDFDNQKPPSILLTLKFGPLMLIYIPTFRKTLKLWVTAFFMCRRQFFIFSYQVTPLSVIQERESVWRSDTIRLRFTRWWTPTLFFWQIRGHHSVDSS